MNLEELKLLISQDEGETIEFKQQWYRFEGEGKTRQEGEFIKDILSLANGSAYSAGKDAYLIVGVSNKRNEDGSRDIFDVGEKPPTAMSILNKVRPRSSPPLETVQVESFRLDDKQVFVVIIPFTQHLYETTWEIDTIKCSYTRYVVFIRAGEGIKVASSVERDAILKAKIRRLTETQNVPPVVFGAVLGAIVSSIVLAPVGDKIIGSPFGNLVGACLGIPIGGYFGAGLGYIYKSAKGIGQDLPIVRQKLSDLIIKRRKHRNDR